MESAQSASMATRFYDETGSTLRRRHRSPPPQVFSSGLAARLHTFQAMLQEKLPGLSFEMEHVSTNEAECIVTGITGSIEMLKRLQKQPFLFFVENGRVVIRYVPECDKPQQQHLGLEKTVFVAWILVFLVTGLFVFFNLENYKNILM